MSIIELVDIKVKPDIVHEYKDALRSEKTPLVIDNGSYKCRVGWSCNEAPLLDFRNLIAKPRKDRKKDTAETVAIPQIQIGNDITNIETVRQQLKTQFDRNLVTLFHNQEQIFDYILSHLGLTDEEAFVNPVVMTEALGNPNFCRQQMNELLFECYNVPSVCYGIDALFSWQENKSTDGISEDNALIISFGYHTTHVVPVLGGKLQADRVRRINVGGYHIITYLFRLMQMKYPVHLNAITISRMEILLHNYSSIALDYKAALQRWAGVEYYEEHVKKIQLPYTMPAPSASMTVEQKIERRKELSRRLIDINNRRAKEKQLEDEQQLERFVEIRQLYELGGHDEFEEALRENGIKDLEELSKLIVSTRTRIERAKQKTTEQTENGGENSKKESNKVSGIKPPAEVPLEKWIADVKEKRCEILKRKSERKVRRQDLAKRHTAAAQERMRIISLLARNERDNDEFGMDDKDWDVYKVINRDNDSDSEGEAEKLLECENILRQYDGGFDEQMPLITEGLTADQHQLHVGVECIRAPEILFQPSMIGSGEAGLAELIEFVLKQFSASEQLLLANNVFLSGGCAQLPGLRERLSKELLEMRPFQTPHKIYESQNPSLDAWLGARQFACSDNMQAYLTTKAEYQEKGSEYFKEHQSSNFYFPTPK